MRRLPMQIRLRCCSIFLAWCVCRRVIKPVLLRGKLSAVLRFHRGQLAK